MTAARPASGARPEEARQARDAMALGQDTGRVLSDGRIVGRAEPFAKVFTSSRAVKRVVGAVAWVVLEDIALDATIDAEGRLVAQTSVRRIAGNLALNKDTVTRHLGRLREHGFVLHEEGRAGASGRFEACRYVLDPSACVERFTRTPTGAPTTHRRAVGVDIPQSASRSRGHRRAGRVRSRQTRRRRTGRHRTRWAGTNNTQEGDRRATTIPRHRRWSAPRARCRRIRRGGARRASPRRARHRRGGGGARPQDAQPRWMGGRGPAAGLDDRQRCGRSRCSWVGSTACGPPGGFTMA